MKLNLALRDKQPWEDLRECFAGEWTERFGHFEEENDRLREVLCGESIIAGRVGRRWG